MLKKTLIVDEHKFHLFSLVPEEESNDGHVSDWEPKVDLGEELVLFEEEVGPVADVKVSQDEAEFGQTPEHRISSSLFVTMII